MNFPAQRILSFCWFHSEVVTPPKVDLQRSWFAEGLEPGDLHKQWDSEGRGSGLVSIASLSLWLQLGLSQFLIPSIPTGSLWVAVLHSSILLPLFLLPPYPVFLLTKSFFYFSPFLFLLDEWLPWGLLQLAVFTSGKMHFILLCLSSAVVAQDTPGLRRLLSAAAISPACGLICLRSPQPCVFTCLLTAT